MSDYVQGMGTPVPLNYRPAMLYLVMAVAIPVALFLIDGITGLNLIVAIVAFASFLVAGLLRLRETRLAQKLISRRQQQTIEDIEADERLRARIRAKIGTLQQSGKDDENSRTG